MWTSIYFRGKYLQFSLDNVIKPRPDLWDYYGIRHSDTDWSRPITIEPHVLVNKWGILRVPKGEALPGIDHRLAYLPLKPHERKRFQRLSEV